jgi:hypothetical protein
MLGSFELGAWCLDYLYHVQNLKTLHRSCRNTDDFVKTFTLVSVCN